MKKSEEFLINTKKILDNIYATQLACIEQTAAKMADAICSGANIFVYGTGHAAIMAEEMHGRAGGLVPVNPLFCASLLPYQPVITACELERIPGVASAILQTSPIKPGDLLIIHSVAARNPAVVEMAIKARDMGVFVVGLVNITFASGVASRDPSGKLLQEVCDIVIDNCGEFGDASISIEGMPGKTAPTSTISCAFIANMLTLLTCEYLLERGVDPPVLLSANIDNADSHNQALYKQYEAHVFYS